MIEQHSIASLSARLGVSRGATLGALAGGKLPVLETIAFGARKAYKIEGGKIETYKAAVLEKLSAKIAKVSSDPIRRRELTASALGAMRRELEADQKITSAIKTAERYGISIEAAAFVLMRYARRVKDGFKIDAAARASIEKHIRETRGGAAIRNAGGPFVS